MRKTSARVSKCGPEGGPKVSKRGAKERTNESKGAKRDPKVSQMESRNFQKHTCGKRVEKVRKKEGTIPGFGEPFWSQINVNQQQMIKQNNNHN